MRPGVRLGIDVGSVRIGVARSDPLGRMAIPLETVRRHRRGADIRQIMKIAEERSAIEIVIGLPVHLAGTEGASARVARQFGEQLSRKLPGIRICLVDERLSSTQAHGRLAEAGLDSRGQRPVVDQVAAQIILEQALEQERLTGKPPGIDVSKMDERNIRE